MICQTMPLHQILSLPPTLTTQFCTRLSAPNSLQALADSDALEGLSLQNLGVASADACILILACIRCCQPSPAAFNTVGRHNIADFQDWLMCHSFCAGLGVASSGLLSSS